MMRISRSCALIGAAVTSELLLPMPGFLTCVIILFKIHLV